MSTPTLTLIEDLEANVAECHVRRALDELDRRIRALRAEGDAEGLRALSLRIEALACFGVERPAVEPATLRRQGW